MQVITFMLSLAGCAMYKIEHYKTGAGKDLIKDYIDEASRKYGIREVALIRTAVMLLRNHGFDANRYKKQLIKKLESGLYELRPGSNRILFFFYDGERFVLLHGFRKKTQKTPRHEIDTARAQMDEYIRRNK